VEGIARVVLGVGANDVAEEVMHFLDRSGTVTVVGTASDELQLREAVRQLEPDAVVATPRLLRAAGSFEGATLLAVDTRETVESLRGAIECGAKGYYLWPADREELAGSAARLAVAERSPAEKRAVIVAVYGPRGGSGATFIATHLASAFAQMSLSCVLVDCDPSFAELTIALGVKPGEEFRTIADLAPVADELTPDHLEGVLWSHPHGFRALLAPSEGSSPGAVEPIPPTHVFTSAIDALASLADVIVLHLPRSTDDLARAAVTSADRSIVVLSLDVLSFHGARRALALLAPGDARVDFVVNRAARADIVPGDVERVFGRPPIAVIPMDRSAVGVQDRGRLVSRRGPAGRAIAGLAARIVEAESQ
jgi:pilus assembly protein CpaE